MSLPLLVATVLAGGGDEVCRVVDVEMTPSEDLQIVVWLEDAEGQYVDTLYLTESVGLRGLGNRPGRMDFNTAWRWPYGRRESTFPVWAHRHGYVWPRVVFQNYEWPDTHNEEDDLSHPFGQSSPEAYFCRPLREGEVMWDQQSCASMVYTDKGVLSPTEDSLYPPRADISFDDGIDDLSVSMFDEVNPFDAVTAATPVSGVRFEMSWSVPNDLPIGDYVMWIEVAKELDHNDTYNPTSYPEPDGILYGDYGIPYRGQPSIVHSIPFAVGLTTSVGTSTDFVGYGDPDGIDGDIRPPDDTIDREVPGSGSQRLLTMLDGGDVFRAKVTMRVEMDDQPPSRPEDGEVLEVTASSATVRFVEPGDDGLDGVVDGYEVRYRAGVPITEDNFLDAVPASVNMTPAEAGVTQQLTIDNLLPQTTYYIAVRAYDDCKNYGPLEVIELVTSERETGEVDACFIATAAYGSLLADDVEMLRQVRDGMLRTNVPGELLVEAYYTFGPVLSGLIGESEELRGLARDLLDPLVDYVKELSFTEAAPEPSR